MNDITYAVSVDVNNPIIPYNVYVANVLDSNVRYLEITLYQNGNVIALSNAATATASLVTDNVLVDDSVNCTISDNIITVPLEDLQRHGNLDVQVTVTEGTKVLAIPFPIQVRVTPNIAENAQIDENSLGSYAEVVHEITEARGTHTTLHDAITAKLSAAPGAVDTENLADESITVEKVADDLAAVINAKEAKSNKKTTLTGNESSNDFYPTTKAVADALEVVQAEIDTVEEGVHTIIEEEVGDLKSAIDILKARINPVTECETVVDLPWERGFITNTGANRDNSTDQLFLRTPQSSMYTNNGELLILRISSNRQCILRFYDANGTYTVSKPFTATHNVIDLSSADYSGANYAKYRIVINNKTGVSSAVEFSDFCFSTVNLSIGYVYADTFGAVADGITISTNQIQAAIDYCIANSLTLKLLPNRTYVVRQILITDTLNLDGCGAILKGNTSNVSIVSVNCAYNKPNGHIKNLIINCDYIANGILITEDWRRNYSNITIKNVADGGKGLSYKKGGGNFFTAIRGRYDDFTLSKHLGTALFIEIIGADSSFRDVDYQYYRYGLDISAVVKLDNIHGYINKYAMYDGSYFIRVRPWASVIAVNLYPDTVESMFFIQNVQPDGHGKQVLIVNGLYTYFNGNTDITENNYAQPYVFYFEGEHRAFINVCGAFLNAYDAEAESKLPLALCNANRDAISLLNYTSTNVVVGS